MKIEELFFRQLGCRVIAALFVLAALTGCGSGYAPHPYGSITSLSATTVAVYPLDTEDLQSPCTFDLLLQEPDVVQAGTLVVYERGDSRTLFDDATLQATARALHFSMVWAHECDAASTGAFQADASKGPARVLFAALAQFASNTSRPELATGGIVPFGFSAAGVLTATLTNLQPDRVLAAVEYASGDVHVDLERVPVSAAAAQIPTLILANAQDVPSGTFRSLDYFTRGRAQGALWAFGVQHATEHCCTLSTRNLLVPFLQAVAAGQSKSAAGAAAGRYPAQTFSQFLCTPDGTVDDQGYIDCSIGSANVTAAAHTGSYGWLPDQNSASAWLTWVLNTSTN